MTSIERHEIRYKKRKERRLEKKLKRFKNNINFDEIFTFKNLIYSYYLCRKNVSWKASIQRYTSFMTELIIDTFKKLHNGTFHHDDFYQFDIVERGKPRHISSVTVRERVVQRCLCDFCLVPIIGSTFIYDNGASMRRKGYSFSIRRTKAHLQKYYRKNNFNNNGYVLTFDFSSYFNTIPHELIKTIIDKTVMDDKLKKISYHFVTAFEGEIGLGLGSQISQIFALAAANQIDHLIKEKLQIKYYSRYMDDGYLIHHDKKYLEYCKNEIIKLAEKLGLKINKKKTHIKKISQGFQFLKARFFLTKKGNVVKKNFRQSVRKMRIKLRSFKHFINEGKMTLKDVYASFQSWRAYARNFNAFNTIKTMIKLFINTYKNEGGFCYDYYHLLYD